MTKRMLALVATDPQERRRQQVRAAQFIQDFERDLTEDMEGFQSMINEFLDIMAYSDDDAARILGTSRPTITRWKTGAYSPVPLVRNGCRDRIMEQIIEITRPA